jgi:hypothetical protein
MKRVALLLDDDGQALVTRGELVSLPPGETLARK